MEHRLKAAADRSVLNSYEAAKKLGVGHNRVRELVRAGTLRALPGRNIRIPIKALEDYLETASRDVA
jgi:excisionase family DNA binding protein